MGLFKWLKSDGSEGAGGSGGGRVRASAPSSEHAAPLDAIRFLLEAQQAAGDDGMWLTLKGAGHGREAIVEVSGESLNFCTAEVDVPDLLRSLGCAALADQAAGANKGDDRTLWPVPGATPEQLALVIDIAFARVLGLGEAYCVEGERHA